MQKFLDTRLFDVHVISTFSIASEYSKLTSNITLLVNNSAISTKLSSMEPYITEYTSVGLLVIIQKIVMSKYSNEIYFPRSKSATP